jgi:serine/threonine protein phosphatase PrpC
MITETQSQIVSEEVDGEVSSCGSNAWTASYVSRRNPFKVDEPNEDSLAWYQVDDDSAVFAVADGCGGMRGGEQASQLALKILGESIASNAGDRLRPAILDGIEQANLAIRDLKIGAACTLAVVEYHRGMARPYHVGDAKILIMGGMGRVRYQSICHSPVGFAVESGWLEAEDAMHHEDRHLVSNVVGCERMRIEIGPSLPLGPRDTIAIASDGVFDNVAIPEGIELLRKGPLDRAVAAVVDLACARMHGVEDAPCKPDDISLIAVRQRLFSLRAVGSPRPR